MVITPVKVLITVLTKSHEPPSRVWVSGLSGSKIIGHRFEIGVGWVNVSRDIMGIPKPTSLGVRPFNQGVIIYYFVVFGDTGSVKVGFGFRILGFRA